MDNTALLVSLFCLLACLQPATQQVLKRGENCWGEKKHLCPPGTTCQVFIKSMKISYCSKVLGQKCKNHDLCPANSRCDREKKTCMIYYGGDCKGKRKDMCIIGHSCDANSKCRVKVKGRCWYTYNKCVAGAVCKDFRCTCIPGLWKRKEDTCVPLQGKVGGKCLENNTCTAPHSQCNNATNHCECATNYLRLDSDYTCKSLVGGSCTHTQNCTSGAICDPSDNKCRLTPGQSCAGDKANFCQSGKPCVNGYCRLRVGEPCTRFMSTIICEPPSVCWSKGEERYECGIRLQGNCANHRNNCISIYNANFCDPKFLTCQSKINTYCSYDRVCPYGAVCQQHSCQCLPPGHWNETNQACDLPEGKIRAKCRAGSQCDDPAAMCNADGVCECKTGYSVDPHRLTCYLKGPKCFTNKDGAVKTYFGDTVLVGLPCGFKLAKFRCGRAVVEVFANKVYSPRIRNNYISALNVTITGTTKNGTSTTNTFTIEFSHVEQYMRKNRTKGSAWRVVPGQNSTVRDDYVRLSTSGNSGVSVLLRKLMKITYAPPVLIRNTDSGVSQVQIECGQDTFKSLEEFPVSLCGRPEDKEEEVYQQYADRVQKRLKREMPDDFFSLYVPSEAFSPVRLVDRAILLEQQVSQRNAYCQEASAIVKGECPALQAKLYNCSHMYDSNTLTYTISDRDSYARCVDKVIEDPTKLFVSCLNVLCNRLEGDRKNVTCQTLKTASDLCDDIENTQPPSDLMALANCTTPPQ